VIRALTSALAIIVTLAVYPAFAESPLTVQNAVGNIGNTSGQAAVGTSGNVNQNNNQNSLGLSNTTSQTLQGVNIGGISLSGGGGGGDGVGALSAGEGAGYSGTVSFASPAITFGSSRITNVNLPGLPGIMGAPGNFSQPYKPDVFINGAGPVRPSRMTYEQAAECRGGVGYKDSYVGGTRPKAGEITLMYAAWDKIEVTNDISNYVGITSVEGADKPWLPAVCEAAFHAMERGANYGVVEFIIRPKNTMKGFGVGWSSQRVEGEIMIQVTGLRLSAPPASPVTQPPAPKPVQAEVPARPAPNIVVPNGKPLKLPAPIAPNPEAEPRSNEEGAKPEPARQSEIKDQPRNRESKLNAATGEVRATR
jgi:hypothetical protein